MPIPNLRLFWQITQVAVQNLPPVHECIFHLWGVLGLDDNPSNPQPYICEKLLDSLQFPLQNQLAVERRHLNRLARFW